MILSCAGIPIIENMTSKIILAILWLIGFVGIVLALGIKETCNSAYFSEKTVETNDIMPKHGVPDDTNSALPDNG